MAASALEYSRLLAGGVCEGGLDRWHHSCVSSVARNMSGTMGRQRSGVLQGAGLHGLFTHHFPALVSHFRSRMLPCNACCKFSFASRVLLCSACKTRTD